MKELIVIAALMFPFAVNANPYDWKVVRAVDGDTLEILGSCSDDVANKNEEYRWHEESL